MIRMMAALLLLPVVARADQAVLESWLKRQATITSLEAAFTQERRLPSLKEPVSTRGKLSVAKPDRVRWQLGEPAATIAYSDGVNFTLVDCTAKTARVVAADSPQAARFSVLTGKGFRTVEDFNAVFEVAEHRIDSGIHQFTLKPKDRKLRAQVPWMFLHIDPKTNDLKAMEMQFKDKSRVKTVFDKPAINPKLPDSVFKPDLTGFEMK